MAQLNTAFDVEDVDDEDVLPAGDYPMRITHSEEGPTKNGRGRILTLTMKVEDGPYKGRMHWERLNYVNQNATAQNIAGRTLKKIMTATGVPSPLGNSDDLHNKPFIATLKVLPDDGWGAKNELKNAKPWGSKTVPPANQKQGGQQQSGDSSGDGDMPWDD